MIEDDAIDSVEELFAKDQLSIQGYNALPARFQEVIALFHDGNDSMNYEAPAMYGEKARSTLWWMLIFLWVGYGAMMYFTLVNYSFWISLKANNDRNLT